MNENAISVILHMNILVVTPHYSYKNAYIVYTLNCIYIELYFIWRFYLNILQFTLAPKRRLDSSDVLC